MSFVNRLAVRSLWYTSWYGVPATAAAGARPVRARGSEGAHRRHGPRREVEEVVDVVDRRLTELNGRRPHRDGLIDGHLERMRVRARRRQRRGHARIPLRTRGVL